MPGAESLPSPTDDPPGVEVGGPTSVVLEERGSFAHAACAACGWVGPARRSRGKARGDAEAHPGVCPDQSSGD